MPLRQAQLRLEQKQYCRFTSLYQTFDKDDQTVLDSWVKERKAAGWIARVISSDGNTVSEKTIKKHLDGACCCLNDAKHKGSYRASA